jgi:pre-rRNA-processing protein TSR2
MAVDPIFEEAMEKVFSHWTILNLAVEQAWGGRDSRAKADQLKWEIIDGLAAGGRRKRPPCHTNEDDVQEFADFLYERLYTLFHCDSEDGSDAEVATVCLRLYNTCRAGDVTFAKQFLQSLAGPADLTKCQGVDRTLYATEEDEMLDKLGGMDLDSDDGGTDDDGMEDEGAGEGEQGAAAAGAQSAVAEPIRLGKGYASAEAEQLPQAPRKEEPPPPQIDEDGFEMIVKTRKPGRGR